MYTTCTFPQTRKRFIFPGLEMTDIELDERIAALEENGGGSPEEGEKLLNDTSHDIKSVNYHCFF